MVVIGEKGVDAQVADGQIQQFALGPQHPQKGGRAQKEGQPGGQAGDHDHQAGAGEQVVGLPLLPLPQSDGDEGRRAHADEVGQREVDDHEGKGQIEGGKGGLPQELPHKDAVEQAVQRGGQHTDRPGYGGQKEQTEG